MTNSSDLTELYNRLLIPGKYSTGIFFYMQNFRNIAFAKGSEVLDRQKRDGRTFL
jgi:hypothetical protein